VRTESLWISLRLQKQLAGPERFVVHGPPARYCAMWAFTSHGPLFLKSPYASRMFALPSRKAFTSVTVQDQTRLITIQQGVIKGCGAILCHQQLARLVDFFDFSRIAGLLGIPHLNGFFLEALHPLIINCCIKSAPHGGKKGYRNKTANLRRVAVHLNRMLDCESVEIVRLGWGESILTLAARCWYVWGLRCSRRVAPRAKRT